jgi:myosin-5
MTAQQATVIHTVGSKVWVKDGVQSWVKAEVQKIEHDVLIVALEEGEELRKVNPEEAPLQNVDTRGVEVCIAAVFEAVDTPMQCQMCCMHA